MSFLDDILKRKDAEQPAMSQSIKLQAENPNTSANGGELSLGTATPTPPTTVVEQPIMEEQPKRRGYVELFQEFNELPSPEELEKEKKRHKQRAVIAAIGDGLSALANMYYVNKGAQSMYDGKNTLSDRERARYDKFLKDREGRKTAYYNALMRARQADEEATHRERSWQRQLGLDQEARDRYNKEQAERKARVEEDNRRWQTTFDEDKRRSDRLHNFQVQQHNDNVSVRREQARATAARAVRGKQLGFSDGAGKQMAIYENVWKASMPQVYDVLAQEMSAAREGGDSTVPRLSNRATPSEREQIVKQNWHKYPRATALMLALSKIDPATMTSTASEAGDDIVDYVPGGEEIIDYVPGK